MKLVACVLCVLMLPVIALGFVFALVADAAGIGRQVYADIGDWVWRK